MKNIGKEFHIELFDNINIKDNLDTKLFGINLKKFKIHSITGWFSSKRVDLSPEGVQKTRIIDRIKNIYIEKIVDYKTGRIIRDVKQKLTQHK